MYLNELPLQRTRLIQSCSLTLHTFASLHSFENLVTMVLTNNFWHRGVEAERGFLKGTFPFGLGHLIA